MANQTFRRALAAGALLAPLALTVLGTAPTLAQDNSAATQPTQPGQPDPKLVVAKVNGKDITRQDVINATENMRPEVKARIDELFPQILDYYIFLQLVAEKGRAEGMDKDPEVTKIVDEWVTRIEDNAIRQIFVDRYIKSKVTDEAVDARYNELKAKFDEDVKKMPPEREIEASHILVKTEDEAKAIIAELEKGADFGQVAVEKSLDPSAKNNKGALGWFTKGMMVKEFEEAAFAMKQDEISKAPVKSQFGFHIIKLTGDRTKALPTFDKKKEEVRLDLADEAREELAKSLRDEAKVELIDPNGGVKPAQ